MVADTYSNTLGYLVMGTGNDNNSWGSNANTAVFQIFEDAIANALSSAVTGGTLDLSTSPPPAGASAARYAGLIFTGTLLSNQVVQVPNLTKWWWVKNATSGSFTLKFKTSGGSASSAIPQNSGWQLVQCDGADGIIVSPFNSKQVQMPDGTVALPAYSNLTEPSSGWYRAGTQDWRFAINGLDVFQVTGAGASSPSIVNVLSPNVLQQAGAQIIPPGAEQAYAGIALPAGGWLWEDGTAYSRSTYAALFEALSATCTGNTNSNTTLNNLSVDLRGKGLEGAYLECTGVPTGTTIVSIASATSLTLSQAATATASGLSIRILPHGQGDASTTFNVPDRRYRVLVGRDNMNNNPAARSSTYAGTKLSTSGGAETVAILQANLPSVNFTVTDAGHVHGLSPSALTGVGGSGLGGAGALGSISQTQSATTGISVASGGSGTAVDKMQPFGITNYIVKT